MFFGKLVKKAMAVCLAGVMALGGMAFSDMSVNSVRAEDAVSSASVSAVDIFKEGKVFVNRLGFLGLTQGCFDKEGKLKPGYTMPPQDLIGSTYVEVGYDVSQLGKYADLIVDREMLAYEKNCKSFVVNVFVVDNNANLVQLYMGKDFTFKFEPNSSDASKMKVVLSGMDKYKGTFSVDIDVYDRIIESIYSNTSVVSNMVSKLFELEKAYMFSFSKDPDSFKTISKFAIDNPNAMIDAGEYDLFYLDSADKTNIKRAKILISKYKVTNRMIEWNVKEGTKYAYDGKAHAPKVTKIKLTSPRGISTNKNIVNNFKDITSGFKYSYIKTDKDGKVSTVESCKDVGKYTVVVKITGKNGENFEIPMLTENNKLSEGVLNFEIVNAKSINKAKATVKKVTYNKANQTANVTKVTLNGKTLKQGTDYTVAKVTKKNAGSYNVTITGKGDYKGTLKAKFVINRKSILKCKFYPKASMTMDGSTILKRGKDYKLGIKKNRPCVIGIGNYTGTKVFNDVIKNIKNIKKVSKAKKK